MAAEVHAVGPGLAALTGSTSPGASRYRVAPAGRRQGRYARASAPGPQADGRHPEDASPNLDRTDPFDLY